MSAKRFSPKRDYPLASKRPDLVKTPSGKNLQAITLDNVASGKIAAQEIRIRPETLKRQAQVAEAYGRAQLAANFRRAAELTSLPDQEILRIYDALRPHRSTKDELLVVSRELEERYRAPLNAAFIREAVEIYERRDLLKKD